MSDGQYQSADKGNGPYRGLSPFTGADRDFFFGRDDDIEIIAANLLSAPITALYGGSGVGKSSLLQAGVIPNLVEQDEALALYLSRWHDGRPLAQLEGELRRALARDGDSPGDDGAADRHGDLAGLAGDFAARSGRPLVLVLDQFEEFFLYTDAAAADDFARALARLVYRAELDCHLLISLRKDGLSLLDRLGKRLPDVLANPLELAPLNDDQARDAIEKPLAAFAARHPDAGQPKTAEATLVEALLDSVRKFGEPDRAAQRDAGGDIAPFLQLALEKLWQRECVAGSEVLRKTALDELGGTGEIINKHLRGSLRALDRGQQRICADCLNWLVNPSGSKIAQSLADLSERGQHGQRDIRAALARLSGESRILREIPHSAEQDEAQSRYELYHDVLGPHARSWCDEQLSARRRRRAMGISALSLLAALALGLFGLWALEQKSAAESLRAEAEQQRIEAIRNESLTLGSLSRLLVDERPDTAAVLAWRGLPKTASDPRPRLPSLMQMLATVDAGNRQSRVLEGHQRSVTFAQFSPDSLRIVTASDDSSARLWDAESHAQIDMLEGHGDWVLSAQFSADGERIVTASADDTARLWDARSGAQLRVFEAHGENVNSARFSADGGRIVTASDDQTARIWSAYSDAELAVLAGHEGWVRAAQFSADGGRIVTASEDGTARLWDARNGAQLAVLEGHEDAVRSARFSTDGERIVTASEDGTARLWDGHSGAQLDVLVGHEDSVLSAQFSADGERIVSASNDGTARLWDARTGVQLAVLEGHGDSVASTQFSADGGRIVTASGDATVRLWDAHSGAALAVLAGHLGEVTFAGFSPDGERIVTASRDGTTRLWHAPKTYEEWLVHIRERLPRTELTAAEKAEFFLE